MNPSGLFRERSLVTLAFVIMVILPGVPGAPRRLVSICDLSVLMISQPTGAGLPPLGVSLCVRGCC